MAGAIRWGGGAGVAGGWGAVGAGDAVGRRGQRGRGVVGQRKKGRAVWEAG